MSMAKAQALQEAVAKNYSPGQTVELFIGIGRDLSIDELSAVQERFAQGGLKLLSPLAIGASPWPNTLRLVFANPEEPPGVGFILALPLAVLVIGALGVVGIGAFLGFKLGNVVDSLAKNLLPITLITVGGLIVWGFLTRQPAKTR